MMTGVPPADDDTMHKTTLSRLKTDELLDSFGKVAPKLKELVRCGFDARSPLVARGCERDAVCVLMNLLYAVS